MKLDNILSNIPNLPSKDVPIGKDENSNIQPPRHDSISPASMDSSIQDDENRVAKSKFFLFLLSVSRLLVQQRVVNI